MSLEDFDEYKSSLSKSDKQKFLKYQNMLNKAGIPVSVSQYKIYLDFRSKFPFDSSSDDFYKCRFGDNYYYDIMINTRTKSSGSLESYIMRDGEELGRQKYEQFRKNSSVTKEKYLSKGNRTEADWDAVNKSKSVTKDKFLLVLGRTEQDWENLIRSKKHTIDVYVEKYGNIEGTILFEEYKKKSVLYSKDGKSNQLAYYTSLGMSHEDAQKALSKRQSTFSLEKCIQKYGEIEGAVKWKARQDKWQNSLNTKSKDEISIINTKRGMSKSGVPHKGGINEKYFIENDQNHTKSGLLYYVKFYNESKQIWKIGITTRSVIARFGTSNMFHEKYGYWYDILFQCTENLYKCYVVEQKILNDFSANRISYNMGKFRSTELFDSNILNEEVINECFR